MTSVVPTPPTGHFTVLYFAAVASYTSKESESLEAPLPLGKLFDVLEDKYPGIEAKLLGSCLVTVNLEYVDVSGEEEGSDTVVIGEGDEVAIIPPVSSG